MKVSINDFTNDNADFIKKEAKKYPQRPTIDEIDDFKSWFYNFYKDHAGLINIYSTNEFNAFYAGLISGRSTGREIYNEDVLLNIKLDPFDTQTMKFANNVIKGTSSETGVLIIEDHISIDVVLLRKDFHVLCQTICARLGGRKRMIHLYKSDSLYHSTCTEEVLKLVIDNTPDDIETFSLLKAMKLMSEGKKSSRMNLERGIYFTLQGHSALMNNSGIVTRDYSFTVDDILSEDWYEYA